MIPKKFTIDGKTYTIKYDKDLQDREGAIGQINYRRDVVYLKPFSDGEATEFFKESVFYHELAHAILYAMEEDELRSNEKFVDHLGNKIHQFVNSAKY